MRLLYSFFISLYSFSALIASLFNEKAARWSKGRQGLFKILQQEALRSNKWIWFHAASLGEFEQGRPVIEAIKKERPNMAVLLTFFSPSGYEIRKDYPLASCVAYLPADTLPNAKKLCKLFRFEAAYFIKYEFWFNYLYVLDKQSIPTYFISARFRPEQHFFRWYGSWFRKHLRKVKHFFVQDENSVNLLSSIDIQQVTRTGDTRFDRVAGLAKQASRFPLIEAFKGEKQLFIAGSSWPEDELFLLPVLKKLPSTYKTIIAPHDVSAAHVQSLLKQSGSKACLYSRLSENADCDILIIDSVGILSQLYQYARFVYIGGGFGKNIHNIQEPVTFGCPVIIGPKHQQFTEANELVELGGAFVVNDGITLENILLRLADDEHFHTEASLICKNYVSRQTGATALIMQYLQIQS